MTDTSNQAPPAAAEKPDPFPRSFWTANGTELLERGAYYAMASFVVIYLGRLGMGSYWPSNLNGLLWTLVYFLPILSGTIADYIGFRKALLGAFVLLAAGYTLMGAPVWFGGAELYEKATETFVAPSWIAICVAGAILLIGLGGSVIKPCISGTVQKTSGKRATLAFAIFYMVINIGSLFGRGIAYVVRTHSSLVWIFAVAAICSVAAFLVVLLIYRDPEKEMGTVAEAKPRRSILQILIDMVTVLANPRFALFLLANSGFTFLYAQVYNVMPLYLEKVLEKSPPVDIYTMANPFTIVFFQLAITKMFGKLKPIVSIVIGTILISVSMVVNIVPLFMDGGSRATFADLLPIGSLFIVMTVACVAFGELFASARQYEYIGSLAPKGKEGLFLGYANLPMAIGALTGGPVGAFVFNEIMCRDSVKNADGLLDLNTTYASLGWGLLMGVGLISAALMWWYNRWITRTPIPQPSESAA
ncbi:MAG: MFS transporter [Polyangiaceae bacterium]|nr:MFS transporter [Polyangiaceae bacterium]